MKYYVQVCHDGVELEVVAGPFASYEARNKCASDVRKTLDPIETGIFWLDIAQDGTPTSGSYSDEFD